MDWKDGMASTPFGVVEVHGYVVANDDPVRWEWYFRGHHANGFPTEQAAKSAAEAWLREQANALLEQLK